MVRIGVYRGFEKDETSGLSLLNFDVLNELEETENKLSSFQIYRRFNDWSEPMMENRIYFVNIIPEQKNKPIKKFEILDKCKFIVHENGKYQITYPKHSGEDLIELYEKGVEENKKHGLSYNDPKFNVLQEYIEYCLSQPKTSRLHFNTFTKFILERIFEKYGYENVIHYRTKNELKKWSDKITKKVKNFTKSLDTKFSDWSIEEEKYLRENIHKPEKELAKALNRTVPSIATKKWKIRHESKSKLKEMKTRAEAISEYLKSFRKEKGYRQKELSKASGISISVISQLECGKYIGTDTPIVEDLLKYVDKESDKLNLSDIPETDTPTKAKADTEPKKVDEPTPEPEPVKEEKGIAISINDLNLENLKADNVIELLSELKFMSSQLLKMQNKLNAALALESNNNNNGGKASVRLVKRLKELQS